VLREGACLLAAINTSKDLNHFKASHILRAVADQALATTVPRALHRYLFHKGCQIFLEQDHAIRL